MKAHLMHRDRDFDLEQELPYNADDLRQDLGIDQVVDAMAAGDQFVADVAVRALLSSLGEPDEIRYRQAILRDCLEQPSLARELYDLAVAAMKDERNAFFGLFTDSPSLILRRGLSLLELFVERCKQLRAFADEHAGAVESDGLRNLFATLATELGDDWFAVVEEQMDELRFHHGSLISAELGRGNRGRRYVLRRPRRRGWRERIPLGERSSYSFQIPDRDEAGHRMLSDLQGRGLNAAANAVAQAADHVLSFFHMLRAEVAFYVGCLNLHAKLTEKGEPICIPDALPAGEPVLRGRGLYDVGLSLAIGERVVGNEVEADGASLVMITGANQGGKSTFLRSAGLAHLMLQCGMFAGAQSFAADVRDGLFTHFRREEDEAMRSGKLDEELARMSAIVDHVRAGSLVLCNESFAATNEREGSQIAREIVRALRQVGVKVLYVTHMYDLAHSLYERQDGASLFLRAERREGGERTFRVVEGEPLPTSFGEDLFFQIFGAEARTAPERSSAGD